MGWKFTADKDKTLKPPFFWGLTRRSLKSKKIKSDSSSVVDSESDEHSQSDSEIEYGNNLTTD